MSIFLLFLCMGEVLFASRLEDLLRIEYGGCACETRFLLHLAAARRSQSCRRGSGWISCFAGPFMFSAICPICYCSNSANITKPKSATRPAKATLTSPSFPSSSWSRKHQTAFCSYWFHFCCFLFLIHTHLLYSFQANQSLPPDQEEQVAWLERPCSGHSVGGGSEGQKSSPEQQDEVDKKTQEKEPVAAPEQLVHFKIDKARSSSMPDAESQNGNSQEDPKDEASKAEQESSQKQDSANNSSDLKKMNKRTQKRAAKSSTAVFPEAAAASLKRCT